jgi:predicted small secreted protein
MKIAFALMAFALAATVSACNTVEGVGKDTQKAGQAIEKTADDAKK